MLSVKSIGKIYVSHLFMFWWVKDVKMLFESIFLQDRVWIRFSLKKSLLHMPKRSRRGETTGLKPKKEYTRYQWRDQKLARAPVCNCLKPARITT